MTAKAFNNANPPEMFEDGLPEGSIIKIIGGAQPVVVMTADEVKSDKKELNNLIFDVSGYDGAAKGYFNIVDKNLKKKNSYPTIASAEKAFGAGNAIENPPESGIYVKR